MNYLTNDGWIITNKIPYDNIPNYPEPDLVYETINKFPNSILFDAEEEARKIGTAKAANMVLLGAASSFLGLSYEMLENGIQKLFGRKGDKIVDINLRSLARGAGFSRK